MSEQTIQNPNETGDSPNHHEERRDVYAELKAGMEKEEKIWKQQKSH